MSSDEGPISHREDFMLLVLCFMCTRVGSEAQRRGARTWAPSGRLPRMIKPLEVVPIDPPAQAHRARRDAAFPSPDNRPSRYTLPTALQSPSPVGYRVRRPLTPEDAAAAMPLLSLERPTGFAAPHPVTEAELFEECALGVLSSRQSTNFNGYRQVTLGPAESAEVARLLRTLDPEAPPLEGASYTHVVLARPYRTPFTLLLTLVGHRPLRSLWTVPVRAARKRWLHEDDIPTIGYLQQLHLGILADGMERAAVIASAGRRRAQVLQRPFCVGKRCAALEDLVGLTAADRRAGWRIALVAQVGAARPEEAVSLPPALARTLGANLLAFRSERIQPGVNAEDKAPAAYQTRQPMDVSDALTEQAGRAAYNAFTHWTGCGRDTAKALLLVERIDVLTPNGKQRLRDIRASLSEVTDRVVAGIPKWIDWPAGRRFSRNAARGKKAFALAGQRIYLVGLPMREVVAAGVDRTLAVRAVGAACARGALYAELMGVTGLPDDCDLLAGICLMAGPVNQNDIGKQFYGHADLLAEAYPDRDPTSLLVWTLKAKTVADPIGNEEQLLNPARQGALVDLRPGPHEVCSVRRGDGLAPLRRRDGRVNDERAFGDVGNFATDPSGQGIGGNAGTPWPWRSEVLW
jgi:hypothetical protein